MIEKLSKNLPNMQFINQNFDFNLIFWAEWKKVRDFVNFVTALLTCCHSTLTDWQQVPRDGYLFISFTKWEICKTFDFSTWKWAVWKLFFSLYCYWKLTFSIFPGKLFIHIARVKFNFFPRGLFKGNVCHGPFKVDQKGLKGLWNRPHDFEKILSGKCVDFSLKTGRKWH